MLALMLVAIPADLITGAAFDYPALIRVNLGEEINLGESTAKEAK